MTGDKPPDGAAPEVSRPETLPSAQTEAGRPSTPTGAVPPRAPPTGQPGQPVTRPAGRPPPPPRRGGPPPLPGQGVRPPTPAPPRPSRPVPPRPTPSGSGFPPSSRPEEASPLSRTWVGGIRVPGAPPIEHPSQPPAETLPVAASSPPADDPNLPLGSRPPHRRTDGPSGWPVAPVQHQDSGSWRAPTTEPSIPRAPAVPTGMQPQVPTNEVQDLKRNLHATTYKLEQAQRALSHSQEKIDALTSQRDAFRTRAEKTERELERKGEELEKLHRQHESLRNLVGVRADRIRELENTVTQRSEKLAESQRSITQLRARLEDQEKQLSSMPPAERDELTRIRGIGPKFATKLAALGVVSYRQIAAWSDADIDKIASEIGARAKRIHKDGWRDSAATLAKEQGRHDSTTPKDEVDQGW